MSATDGVIRKTWEVHCRGCEVPVLGLIGSKAEVASTLRRYGWEQLNSRRWVCPNCVQMTEPRP